MVADPIVSLTTAQKQQGPAVLGLVHRALFQIGAVTGFLAVVCVLAFAAGWRQWSERHGAPTSAARLVGLALVASAGAMIIGYGIKGPLAIYLPGGINANSYLEFAFLAVAARDHAVHQDALVPEQVRGLGRPPQHRQPQVTVHDERLDRAQPGRAWVAGVVIPSGNSSLAPLITRWNGTAWSQVALPASALTLLGPGGLIGAISAASPRNVWAFAETSVWLHYDGTTWTSGRLVKPGPSGQVLTTATLALSKSDVWAFGARERSTGAHAYAAHFNGIKWTATSVPGTSPIVSSSAVRAGDVWAVEGIGPLDPSTGRGALVHWSGGTWHSMRRPGTLAGRPLSSVVARSDSDVWVGGAVTNRKKGTTEAIGHWKRPLLDGDGLAGPDDLPEVRGDRTCVRRPRRAAGRGKLRDMLGERDEPRLARDGRYLEAGRRGSQEPRGHRDDGTRPGHDLGMGCRRRRDR